MRGILLRLHRSTRLLTLTLSILKRHILTVLIHRSTRSLGLITMERTRSRRRQRRREVLRLTLSDVLGLRGNSRQLRRLKTLTSDQLISDLHTLQVQLPGVLHRKRDRQLLALLRNISTLLILRINHTRATGTLSLRHFLALKLLVTDVLLQLDSRLLILSRGHRLSRILDVLMLRDHIIRRTLRQIRSLILLRLLIRRLQRLKRHRSLNRLGHRIIHRNRHDHRTITRLIRREVLRTRTQHLRLVGLIHQLRLQGVLLTRHQILIRHRVVDRGTSNHLSVTLTERSLRLHHRLTRLRLRLLLLLQPRLIHGNNALSLVLYAFSYVINL